LLRKEDKLYEQLFGHIPKDPLERIKFILGKKVSSEKFNKDVQKDANRIKKIRWKTLEFTLWKIVKPSARPRANTTRGYVHMYVPGAKEAGDWFEAYAKENNLPTNINTPCKLHIRIYEKTPSSFSIKKKILAELGLIRPWKRTGDVDNYSKSVMDFIQHGVLSDDCLVTDLDSRIYYSIRPHADIKITYMEKFPEVSG
jgi:Holliday junction resolvase RusA-like endonuclease